MTQNCARVSIITGNTANFAARVSRIHPIESGIALFSAKTVVVMGNLFFGALTRGTAPTAVLRLAAERPLGDTLEMQDVKAGCARPGGVVIFDFFTAHQTLK